MRPRKAPWPRQAVFPHRLSVALPLPASPSPQPRRKAPRAAATFWGPCLLSLHPLQSPEGGGGDGLCPRMSATEQRNARAPLHVGALGSWQREGLRHRLLREAPGNKENWTWSEKAGSRSWLHHLPAGGLGQITEVSRPPLVNGVIIEDPYRVALRGTGGCICGSSLQPCPAGQETNICKRFLLTKWSYHAGLPMFSPLFITKVSKNRKN